MPNIEAVFLYPTIDDVLTLFGHIILSYSNECFFARDSRSISLLAFLQNRGSIEGGLGQVDYKQTLGHMKGNEKNLHW